MRRTRKPPECPAVESCRKCGHKKPGLPNARLKGYWHCDLYDVEWHDCRPEDNVRVCAREGFGTR